ncbi:MAG: hypothetical protein KGK07_14425 [Chloroflexota bacterium]|nr:hypothetical protein [Chloroflexota bacterium]
MDDLSCSPSEAVMRRLAQAILGQAVRDGERPHRSLLRATATVAGVTVERVKATIPAKQRSQPKRRPRPRNRKRRRASRLGGTAA